MVSIGRWVFGPPKAGMRVGSGVILSAPPLHRQHGHRCALPRGINETGVVFACDCGQRWERMTVGRYAGSSLSIEYVWRKIKRTEEGV